MQLLEESQIEIEVIQNIVKEANAVGRKEGKEEFKELRSFHGVMQWIKNGSSTSDIEEDTSVRNSFARWAITGKLYHFDPTFNEQSNIF